MKHPGITLGHEAANAALDNLELDNPTWGDVALQHVERVARREDEFTCEDVRLAAAAMGFPDPPEPRAWGAVMLTAARAGIVEDTDRVRRATSLRVHGQKLTLWRSRLRARAA